MKTIIVICICLFTTTLCSSQTFEESIQNYIHLNNSRDSVAFQVITLLHKINTQYQNICDYEYILSKQANELDYYTEEIIKILEFGIDHQDLSKETRLEKIELVQDRRKRNGAISQMIRELLEQCTM